VVVQEGGSGRFAAVDRIGHAPGWLPR